MNYRHAYHAGNFADVFKHIILARIVEYLKLKDKAFRVIDTHAGIGLYNLSGIEAQKTGEWLGGILPLLEATLSSEELNLFKPLLSIVHELNPDNQIKRYPGSPYIVRQLLRKQDRLTAIELHPADARLLKKTFKDDFQVKAIELDGWLALGAQLPPKEKRGLVLVDPPFEQADEFDRLIDGLIKAHQRWPGGIYALWYPIKNFTDIRMFCNRLASSGIPDIIDVSFQISKLVDGGKLSATGMILVNPPYLLENELNIILPALTRILGVEGGATTRITRLTPETMQNT